MKAKSLFIDTNVLLHYQYFDEIKWLEILQTDKVEIIFPPIIIKELDKHKYNSNLSSKIRKRVTQVIQKLDKLLESNFRASLKAGVEVYFEVKEPLDFAEYHLTKESQDDHLIASILQFKNDYPDSYIVLVTDDLNLKIKAKFRNIEVSSLPDDLKLPDELDPNEKRIKQLEQENRQLKSSIPKLKLSFKSDAKYAEFSLEKPIADLSPNEIEYKLDQVKHKYPKKSLGGSGLVRPPELSFSPEEISKYNAKLEEFYKDYEHYLTRLSFYQNRKRRTIELLIKLVNDGTCPAEDVSIFLDLPDQFRLYDKNKLSDSPSPPEPPQEPKTILEKINNSPLNINPVEIPTGLFNKSTPPNVSLLAIQGLNGDAVEFQVKKLNQRMSEYLDSLYVVFDSYEGASSFRIDYRINAAKVPNEVTGYLDVVIKKV